VKYAPLVWAALSRKPMETSLTWLAILAAFTLFGLMNGLTAAVQRLIENGRTDLLYVEPRFSGSVHGFPIGVREQLTRFDGVTGVASVYGLSGYHQLPGNRVFVQLFDEGGPHASSDMPLTSADWQRLLATPSGLFISGKAAGKWNLKQGDLFTVTTGPGARADGAAGWTFEVLGITDEMPGWFDGFMIGNFGFVDQAKPPQDQGFVYRFRVALADSARADEIIRAIDRHFSSSGTPTKSMTARFRAQNDLTASGGAITLRAPVVAGAGLFMIMLLIANGIAQSVRERLPEFAVLKTLGYRDRIITGLVFAEALIPCVVGAALGTMAAAALAQVPHWVLPPGLGSIPPPAVTTSSVTFALASAVLLALISVIVPVLRLRRLSVVDALAER
jgi:putative ABC transport system permease protein